MGFLGGFFCFFGWVFLLATLRQGDLPEVLRPAPPQGDQLPQEGVRTHLQPPPQEEAEVNNNTAWLWLLRWRL